jgi:general secretion pathway protein D
MLAITFPLLVGAADAPPQARPMVLPPISNAATEPTLELGELIMKVARKSGRQYVLAPEVGGRISVAGFDVDRINHETLLNVLRINGMAAVTQGEIVAVVPDDNTRQLAMPTLTADDPKVAADEFVTRIVQVHNACSAHMVPVLRPLMPQYAHLAAYPPTNALIITDRAANVRRIVALVEQLEKQAVANKQPCADGKLSS